MFHTQMWCIPPILNHCENWWFGAKFQPILRSIFETGWYIDSRQYQALSTVDYKIYQQWQLCVNLWFTKSGNCAFFFDFVWCHESMGLLPDTWNNGLRMRRECRERFPPPPRVSDPDIHHGTCVTHVPWCMSGSLASSFFWSRGRGKRSRHSRRMRNPQFSVSGKRSIAVFAIQHYIRACNRY